MKTEKTKSELLFEELLQKRGFEFEKGEDFFKAGEKCPDNGETLTLSEIPLLLEGR